MDISLTERTTERNPGHLSWNLVREGMRRVSLKVFCIGLRWRVCLFYLPIISTFKHSWKLEGFNTFNFEQWLIVVRHGSAKQDYVWNWVTFCLQLYVRLTFYWHARDSNSSMNRQTRANFTCCHTYFNTAVAVLLSDHVLLWLLWWVLPYLLLGKTGLGCTGGENKERSRPGIQR